MMDDRNRRDYQAEKRKKTKKAREQFMVFVLLLALIPTILAVILFARQAALQRQVEVLEEQLDRLQTKNGATANNPADNSSGGNEALTPLTPTVMPESTELTVTPEPTMAMEPTATPVPTATPTPEATATPTPSPEPTLATDPVTGELLPWAEKKVYLTFDDGPSSNTDELLDLLAKYDVKATFFVIGKEDAESKRLYKRIVDEGHSIGMHSYSHKYESIYKSVEDFEKDFTKISDLLYDTIGYVPDLYRFPGGSSNSKCKELTIQPFIQFLLEKDIRYFDWNVDNGDATGVSYTVEELAENVISAVSKKKVSVVLCHDTAAKTKTLQSMEIVLSTLQEKGAQILPITEETAMVRHVLPEEPVEDTTEENQVIEVE